jgi:transcriptional regulator with PAS, ATPase and Fis domain
MRESIQIFETINSGLVILNQDLIVIAWNRWMEHHSGILEENIVGRQILEFYPNLSEPKYKRFIKSVFAFGNYAYFSQKLHHYLFAMKNFSSSAEALPYMQQSCTAGPLRNKDGQIGSIFIAVQDVTENIAVEMRLKQKVNELENALAKVKLLEGIIPICMYCKKIRDDEESWQQMERYITEHSGAQFSHGICPECFSRKPWQSSKQIKNNNV